ncbi:MarR family transcriptional regulator [Enorma massiliensis]|uniref:MarR family transcriptional regulator n=1 Tax=Enorma massiliensis TaxID=1472761 RepID=UPI0034A5C778
MASKATDISLQGVSDRINGRHAFVHERVLELIARGTTEDGSISFRKGDLAVRLGCCDRSLDRALTRLRREGYIISEPSFDSNGGQLGNVYRVTEAGRARVNGLHGSSAATQASLPSGTNA